MKPSAIIIYHFLQQHYHKRLGQLLGNSCFGCNRANQQPICMTCLKAIKKATYSCSACGKKIPTSTLSMHCQSCLTSPLSFDKIHYIGNYAGIMSDLIIGAKIKKQVSAIEAIKLLQRLTIQQHLSDDYRGYTIVPMPTPKFRLMQRGFNLPTLLAKEISITMNLPIVSNQLVTLPWKMKKQALLSKKQRQQRIIQFKINRAVPKKIIIIDDVLTTGFTVNQLAKALRKNGATHISVYALARGQQT